MSVLWPLHCNLFVMCVTYVSSNDSIYVMPAVTAIKQEAWNHNSDLRLVYDSLTLRHNVLIRFS